MLGQGGRPYAQLAQLVVTEPDQVLDPAGAGLWHGHCSGGGAPALQVSPRLWAKLVTVPSTEL